MSKREDIAKIVVIGSSNTDMVIRTGRIPKPGETILGGNFFMNPGGKGANQAVAAARLGADVSFIAKTGDDVFGREAIAHFINEGIDISTVITDPRYPSGVALITVDKNGENAIVVASGANAALSASDLDAFQPLMVTADIMITQLETPVETIIRVAELARQSGKKLVLNPAPAAVLPDEVFNGLFLITPNETETELMTGISLQSEADYENAAQYFIGKGVQQVMITLGEKGVFVYGDSFKGLIPAFKVTVTDTTAAGDVFNAAVAVALAEGADLKNAALFGCKAAAIAVTRMGAQASAPYRNELAM